MTKGEIFTDEVFTDCCLIRVLFFNTVRCEILITVCLFALSQETDLGVVFVIETQKGFLGIKEGGLLPNSFIFRQPSDED